MSAIAGIYHLNDEPINLEHGNRIMKELEKYPADDIQTWHSDKVFLGCHAQWITPESVGEKLPYYDYERKLAITADAIIDNRVELFEKLQIDNRKRKNITDSELILLSYYKWGEESPKYLVGDFAFMIWDERKQQLFGARDFSGNRTLYFHHNHQRFAFSTVIHPLLKLSYIEKKLNENWIAEFLANPGMFESVDPSSTVFQDIQQIPPSHSIKMVKGKLNISRYCKLPEGEKLQLKSNFEYEEAFKDIFQRAVNDRIRTFHKVGAHLSGGLDSGSVASFAANSLGKKNKKLYTYSYVPLQGFEDWTPKSRVANERPFIESTVNYVGNIEAEYLDFDGESPFSVIDKWLDTLETPYKFFENSFWLKGIYERAHEKGIGVLLNGQRGNWTVSWGPALEYQAMLLKRLHLIRCFQEINLYSKNLGVKKSRVMSVVAKKTFPYIYQRISSENPYAFPMLINPDFGKKMSVFDKLQEHEIDVTGTANPNWYKVREQQFEKLYYWNITGTYGAKFSLPYSVWDRDPTNDLRVVRFCLSVPEEQYVQNGLDRALIRRSTKNLLPDSVRLNLRTRGAQGADGILRMASQWDTFIAELDKMLNDSIVSKYLNIPLLKDIIAKFREVPSLENIYDPQFKVLMRSLIFYRFIKRFT
ncbi:lasso peptide isopeptide bond-forming cyclase [Bacillus sp. ISL-40]|uniref:asparagine synthase-related protein n=1 Tax=unclassified Bacillus (in: firmicutes) TaxID=185979 RepID=UPI001BE60F7D|nr:MULTISPECIES: asparagine synthase-related protein [unclassified Bacillus (in: firmicutes)]MBT2699475.1 lasso peptide isopeptide bond-forming cyclase [Bacillus sp. ISL-40]MBT2722006.1 lasso peptide isopeptide bond-forming cyclase [Bacillus sp. ISL-46]MBT2741646.1 lasso peptide isopeptide bond-forming cyclase [Bacillus sp. ISL-77]